MKVIILAAGRGSRLGELTENKPKMLLDINGENILGRQLRLLNEAGIEKQDINIVVGYEREKIEDFVDNEINIIKNNEFDTKENIYSLYLGLKETDGDFLLLNGDVVFPSQFLEDLFPEKDSLVIESDKDLDKEEMKVKTKKSDIQEINKSMNPKNADGEYIGIAKFSEKGNRTLQRNLKALLESGKTQNWYEKAINQACKELSISTFKISGEWVEVDNKKDLETARGLYNEYND